MLRLLHLLGLPLELIFIIIRFCCVPTLLRLRATCHFLDQLVASELRLRHRLLLQDFVRDISGFTRELTLSRSLVSGSGAVWAHGEPESFKANDLDVYCGVHMSFHVVGYLHYIEGYTIVCMFGPNVQGNYRGGVRSIIRLSNGNTTIDVIQSQGLSAMFPMFFFWSSIPMTFFNEHTVYIAYPRLLEQHRGILNPARCVTTPLAALLKKYNDRGFAVRLRESSWQSPSDKRGLCRLDQNLYCPQTKRAVGDRWGLQTRLGTVEEQLGLPMFVGPIAQWTIVWQLGGHPCGALCAAYEGFAIPTVYIAPLIK